MFASTALLLACFWLLGGVLRGALVGVQARWVGAGRPLAPFALTLRPVPAPAGEEVWYAAGASLWRPAAANGARVLRLGRWLRLVAGGGRRPRRQLGDREHDVGGILVVTSRRVLFRGGRRARPVREDVPLADVAHLRLEGPLLVVERRSRPGAPLPVRVAAAGAVARLILAAAQRAQAPANPSGTARRVGGY
jgi:hypothetical protein